MSTRQSMSTILARSLDPADEGFTDDEPISMAIATRSLPMSMATTERQRQKTKMSEVPLDELMSGVRDTEELAYRLLLSLPRSRLATIQRRIAPLLQFDVVGSFPTEVALQIFSYLSAPTLLLCAQVSQRWQALADDQTLWKAICATRGWTWRHVPRALPPSLPLAHLQRGVEWGDSDDEGMGDSDEEDEEEDGVEAAKAELTLMQAELDSGFASMSLSGYDSSPTATPSRKELSSPISPRPTLSRNRYFSAPSVLNSLLHDAPPRPDYKRLHQTHVRLQTRIRTGSYRLSSLQTRGTPPDAHTNTIYCLQLYTYPETGRQVVFTGSRDRTVREWSIATGAVERVISGVHQSSVLSICVGQGYIASAGSDRQVAVWDLERNKLVRVLNDHEDSVLCVRFDKERLVSCSKDRTVRVYSFPGLELQFVLRAHRAAVNAVSISESRIVSASGDRSVRLWDAKTGKLLRTLENHHTRGIASIDFSGSIILSGSSDNHIRLFDMATSQGWSTSPDYDVVLPATSAPHHHHMAAGGSVVGHPVSGLVCQSCGSNSITSLANVEGVGGGLNGAARSVHTDLVRTVALGEEFVLSGSYDLSIKVWDRKTGALVADLTGGHTGRIFCIGFDSKKIVSCGEDQRIRVWDFSHGIDTSFMA